MMRGKGQLTKILGIVSAFAMLAGLGFASGSRANAEQRYSVSKTASPGYVAAAQRQDRDYDRDYHQGRMDRDDVVRIARENGYRDGFRIGRQDRVSFRHYDADDNPWYRRADSGYDRDMGHFFQYQTAYREAFLRGYSEGFRVRR